jgi:predicted kinase
MSALRPYPQIQAVLDEMEPSGHRVVGWSILTALARSQLRSGRSVVLDGVARVPEISSCRNVADGEGGTFIMITTRCRDLELHRSRVEGRQRHIPNWYELSWDHVHNALESWTDPKGADLVIDGADPWDVNLVKIAGLLSSFPSAADAS